MLKNYIQLLATQRTQEPVVQYSCVINNGQRLPVCDVLDSCKDPSTTAALISFDQEKTFNNVDHKYLCNEIKPCTGIRCFYLKSDSVVVR